MPVPLIGKLTMTFVIEKSSSILFCIAGGEKYENKEPVAKEPVY